MKKISLLISMFILLLISACKKNAIKENGVASTKEPVKRLDSRPLPANDPNLNAAWDWTSPSWTVYFNNANGNVGTVTTLNPFLDGGQKIFGNTNSQQADMFPENGWMLVSRDFGTPTLANSYPFFILYNKYRGVLRVGVLRTVDVQSSYQQISLSFSNSTSTTLPKLFKFASEKADYNTSNANTQFKQSAVTFAGVQEWMIADFNVQGYSATISDYAAINISVSEITQSDVNLAGNINLDGTAQPKAGEASSIGALSKVSSFVSTNQSAIEKAIGSSVNWATGPTLFLKSAINLITGFSGGGAGSTYNIKLNGSVRTSGTIKTTSPKTSFSVYLKPISNTTAYRALQVIPWGIFDINKISIANERYYDVADPEAGYGEDGQPNRILGSTLSCNLLQGCISQASFVVNPAIANDVSSIEANVISGNDSFDPKTFSVSEFRPYTIFESSTQSVGTGLSHHLTVGIKITFKDGSIVYNPIAINSNGVDE